MFTLGVVCFDCFSVLKSVALLHYMSCSEPIDHVDISLPLAAAIVGKNRHFLKSKIPGCRHLGHTLDEIFLNGQICLYFIWTCWAHE